MAIQNSERYYKIKDVVFDFLNNTTNIGCLCYKSKTSRDIEKYNIPLISSFLNKACLAIEEEKERVIQLIGEELFASYQTEDDFALAHPQEYAKLKEINLKDDELNFLRANLAVNKVDSEMLNYMNFWVTFGLSEKLCEQIETPTQERMWVEDICQSDISSVYECLKNILSKNGIICEDC